MAASYGDRITASPHDPLQAAGNATSPERPRSQESQQSSPHVLLAGESATSHADGQQTTEGNSTLPLSYYTLTIGIVPSPVSPLSEDQHSTEQDQTRNETVNPARLLIPPLYKPSRPSLILQRLLSQERKCHALARHGRSINGSAHTP